MPHSSDRSSAENSPIGLNIYFYVEAGEAASHCHITYIMNGLGVLPISQLLVNDGRQVQTCIVEAATCQSAWHTP